jgi:hypothetical protein
MDYVFGLGDGHELGSLVGRLIFGFHSQMYFLLVHDDEQEWFTSHNSCTAIREGGDFKYMLILLV